MIYFTESLSKIKFEAKQGETLSIRTEVKVRPNHSKTITKPFNKIKRLFCATFNDISGLTSFYEKLASL